MKTRSIVTATAWCLLLVSSAAVGCSPPEADAGGADAGDDAGPPPLSFFEPSASVFVDGHAYDDYTRDCRVEMCRHNENTDMIAWNGALWLYAASAMVGCALLASTWNRASPLLGGKPPG